MSEKLIPLYMVADGSKFRVPDKRKVFTKMNSHQTIRFQNYTTDGISVIDTKPACGCKNSSGKTFIKAWSDLVIEVAS
jgi:hypothetical protein